MKRKLLKQIATEWRSNLWLGVELMLISSILFFIFDTTSSHFRIKNTPIGVDTKDVYRLSIGWKNESSPTFEKAIPVNGESQEEAARRLNRENYNFKLRQLRNMDEVMSVAPGSSAPYNYNYNGNQIHFIGNAPDSLENSEIYVNNFYVHTDYPNVFNIHGINGETPEQLSKMLEEGKILVSSNSVKDGFDLKELVNMTVRIGSEEGGETFSIGAFINPIRRADYELPIGGTVLRPDDGLFRYAYVRIRPGCEEQFLDAITAPNAPINSGNSYLIEARSFKDIRNDLHRNDDAQLRNLIICMGFLLMIVFLGLLGTFWFRTQERVREIAMRKVTGACNGQIFRRLMGEGILILAIATIPAMGIDALLVHYGFFLSGYLMPDYNPWFTAMVLAVIIFLLMALMIAGGIYLPARKAMKVEPADVLRGE